MTREHTTAGFGTAVLTGDSDEDSETYTIHGIAIGSGDVTVGSSGVRKLWPDEELREAASTLEGKPLVKDHENSVDGVIGRVTDTVYEENTGVLYEAEISEQFEGVAQKIADGLLEVSVRAYHAPTEELEEDEDTEAKIATDIVFDNLAVVTQGAAPSNTANDGALAETSQERPELSAAELEAYFESDEDSVDNEEARHGAVRSDHSDVPTWEDGDMVRWQVEPDLFGKVVHVDEEKDVVMVEVMGMEDDEMVSTGFTITAGYSDLRPMKMPISKSDMSKHGDDEDDEENEQTLDEYDSEELEHAWHTPEWDGLAPEREWSKPAMEDFDTDEMSEIDDHFFVSDTGEWPPQDYGDLSLPAVFPNGDLSLDGLDSVHQMAGQVEGLSEDMVDAIQSKANELANEHFDQPVADEEMSDTEPNGTDTEATYRFAQFTDDSSKADKSGTSDTGTDELTTTQMEINFHDVDADELEDGHVVVSESELDAVVEKAKRAEELDSRLDEMNSTLTTLSEQTDVLDEVDEDALDELKSADDPVVHERDDYETQMEQVDEIGSIFAELLEEAGSPFDAEELSERFSPLELKAKYEDEYVEDDGSLVDQLGSGDPTPQGEDVETEELEDTGSSGSNSEPTKEEAREYVAQELESKGYGKQAEEMRQGQIPVEEYVDYDFDE